MHTFYRLGKVVDHGKLAEGLKKYFPQKPEELTEDEADQDSEMTQVRVKGIQFELAAVLYIIATGQFQSKLLLISGTSSRKFTEEKERKFFTKCRCGGEYEG